MAHIMKYIAPIVALVCLLTLGVTSIYYQRSAAEWRKLCHAWHERYLDCQAARLFSQPAHNADAVQPTTPNATLP